MQLFYNSYPYYTAPSAPLNVTAFNLSSTSIMVTWQPPMTPNGIVEFYRVEFTSTTNYVDQEFSGSSDDIVDQAFSGSTNGIINEIFTTNTSVMISMLEKFTTYEVQVFATTIAEGNGSDVVIVTTDEDSEFLYIIMYAF